MRFSHAALAAPVVLLLFASAPARAETTAAVVIPDSPVTARSGSRDASVPLGTKGTRALGVVADLGPANSGVATRPIGLGASPCGAPWPGRAPRR